MSWFMNPRKDKYNKSLKKYYVIHEEGDEELSEEEERMEQKDHEASQQTLLHVFT